MQDQNGKVEMENMDLKSEIDFLRSPSEDAVLKSSPEPAESPDVRPCHTRVSPC